MNLPSDIIIYDQNDHLALAVETKTKLNASSEWAARLRCNILAHELLPHTHFFLIATPDRFFVWKNGQPKPVTHSQTDSNISAENESQIHGPTQIIDSKPFLEFYFEQAEVTPEEIHGDSFELMVTAWLSELMLPNMPLERINGHYQKLIDIGLPKAITEGYLSQEVSA